MGKKKIKVLAKKPGKAPYATTINNELKSFQRMVDGHIENFQVMSDMALICNDEGRITGMEYNFHLGGMPFFGPCFFVGTDGEEYTDCPATLEDIKELCPSFLWGDKK